MGQVLVILGPVLQPCLKVQLGLLCIFCQAADVGVLRDLDGLEQVAEGSGSVFLELAEAVVDHGHSFLGDVVPDIGKELKVVDAELVGKLVPDGSDLLGGQEDSGGIGQ